MSSFHFPIMSTFSTFLVYLLLLTIFLDVALALRNPPSGSSSLSSTPTKIGNGYRLISIEEMSNGGLLAYLQVKDMNNIYGPDIPALRLFVKHETGQRLRVHITDAVKPRWEIPCELLPRERPPPLKQSAKKSQKTHFSSRISENELIFNYTVDPFSFTVTRKSDNQTLFDTSSSESDPFSTLVFKDQYLEISTKLPYNASLYGLGENTQPHGIKLHVTEPYTLYTKDVSANNLNTDLYGSHPFYMDLRNVGGQGYVHGVLLLNSNGMDVFYRGNSLTYKVIGGVFDFYFFVGPSPLDVVDQYTSLIGRPAPMPYWAFGFHQCRWGYKNLSMVENVVDNYKKAKIPLDVIWNDADHMDGHKDFTLNPVNFPRTELLAFLNKIHSQGMKYVVIIDPGIAVNSSYGVYKRAVENDVFIKYEGLPFLGQLWPGPVYFPDFLNPKTVSWWMDEIRRFHELVPVDGLWIDMNEISNLCSGMCSLPQGKLCPSSTEPAWTCCLECTNITKTTWDDPPYRINVSGTQAPIGYKTIATSAVHYNGVLEYDAHSLYGLSEAIATHQGLQAVQAKRPFVLSRSTFVGSGKYVAHWTGDNQATWDDLRYSISTMLNFGLFGVPMVGSDICGFMPQTTEELCNRWIELGAFYPFARDHANYNNPSQELYVWDTVVASARKALGMRYKLLPYLYTLNYEAHSTGAPIARPVFFSFENYTDCYNLSTQFLLGSGLMVSPVLQEGATTVTALFPAGSWYNLFDMAQVVVTKEGEYVTLDAPLNAINVHLYQNSIIPMQQGGMTSKEARVTPYELLVTFPFGATEGQAKGNLFVDEGELPEMQIAEGSSTYVDFYATVKDNILKVWSVVQEGKFALDKGWTIEKVTVLGLSGTTSTVTIVVDGNEVAGASAVEAEILDQNYNVNSDVDSSTLQSMQVHNLLISGLSLPIGEEFRLFAPLRI